MRHSFSRLGWLVAVTALVLTGSACDMPDPGDWPGGSEGTNTEVSTATEPGPTDTDPVGNCEIQLQECLASCNGGCADGAERMPADPGDLPTAPETGCVDSCYAQYDACVNEPPKTCETELDQCLLRCPMYDRPADGTDDEGSSCIDSCYWQYDQCIGVNNQCWSDYDCQPGYHCEFWYGDTDPSTGADEMDMPAESGVCVPNNEPNDCDQQLDMCLSQCGAWDCGSAGTDSAMEEDCAPMPEGCEVECWNEYDRCLNGNNGECWSDWDCLPEEHCEISGAACPEGMDCDLEYRGVCVPDYVPEPCEQQLNECLASCPMYDPMPCECPDGAVCSCDYWDPCNDECWAQYDQCRSSGTECWSDYDCQPGFHCEFYGWDYDCEPGMDCGADTMPAEFGTCVPNNEPEPCEQALNECLMQCPVYDCACDPSLDYCDCGGYPDECANECYVQYDQCIGNGVRYCLADEECYENEVCVLYGTGDEYCDESGYCYPTEPAYGICQPIEQPDPCLEIYDACMAECPMIDCDDPTGETCIIDETAYDCYAKCDALYWECWEGPSQF